MKTIAELTNEYEKFDYQVPKHLQKPDAFELLLRISISDTINIVQQLKQEQQENKKRQLSGKIRNLFSFLSNEEEELSFYDEDNKILDEIIDLTLKYQELYLKIINIINLDNVKELIKLLSFGTQYYNENIDYFEARRDYLECAYKGFSYSNTKVEDNRKIILEFLNNKINELTVGKTVEKSKKMC